MHADIRIKNGPTIADGRFVETADRAETEIDATGLDVFPGLIDIHGDAFERALMPRPGVFLPVPIALAELEAQLLAAGITTAFLAITLSWEPGLRSRATYVALRDAILARPAGSMPDLKLHIRFEAHNLADLDLAIADIEAGRIGMVSLNDHTPGIVRKLGDPAAAAKFIDRACCGAAAFAEIAHAAAAHPPAAVAAGRRRLAAAVRAQKIPLASHDDATREARAEFRALGAAICEFPTTETVARDAVEHGESVVMGAPNVVRGGSHMGWHGAEAMVRAGICTVLCSDYHYPSLLHAIYRLGGGAACAFVTANAAAAARLSDRGTLAPGQRADLILVDTATKRVAVTIAGGRIAYVAPGKEAVF